MTILFLQWWIVLGLLIVSAILIMVWTLNNLHREEPSDFTDEVYERGIPKPDMEWRKQRMGNTEEGDKVIESIVSKYEPPSLDIADTFPTVEKVEKIIALEWSIEIFKNEIIVLSRLTGRDKQIKSLKQEIEHFESEIEKLKSDQEPQDLNKDDLESFSKSSNEPSGMGHNYQEGDDKWYKQHMENQSEALKSGERVEFKWNNMWGGHGSNVELFVGDELCVLSDNGDTAFRNVFRKEIKPNNDVVYSFNEDINTNLTFYITKRADNIP